MTTRPSWLARTDAAFVAIEESLDRSELPLRALFASPQSVHVRVGTLSTLLAMSRVDVMVA